MDTNKLRKVKLASIFIIMTFLATSVLSATGGVLSPQLVTNSDVQVVGVYGDSSDSAVYLGMEAYLNTIDHDFQLLSFSQIVQFEGQVVIFAHGDEQGISLSENLLYTWDDFSFFLSSAKADKIILASCFGASSNTDKYSGPELISWDGYIDALLIGYVAALYTLQDVGNNIDLIANKIISRGNSLLHQFAEPIYLAYTPPGGGGSGSSESGYASACKRQNTGSGFTTGRIIWFNYDKETGDAEISLYGFKMASFCASNPALIALIPTPALILILAVLIANLVLISISSYNRIRHDYMFGVQFFKWIPSINFIYHRGNDGYRLDGQITIPYGAAGGIVAYYGIGSVSTSWKSM